MKKKTIAIFVAMLVLGGTSVAMAETNLISPLKNLAKIKANVNKVDTACIQTAVEKRESAIITDFDVKSAAIRTALVTRKTAFKDAWSKTTVAERAKALAQAWKNYHSARVEANKTYQKSIKNAWATFNSERKKCKITETNTENGGTDLGL